MQVASGHFPERVNILGIGVSAINLHQAVQFINGTIAAGGRTYVCVTGVHGIMESQDHNELRKAHHEAGLVTPDGMPLVWIGKLKGLRHMDRVYGPDLMLEMCRDSLETGCRHFFYGGVDGVAEDLANTLQQQFPGLQVAGTFTPPFRRLTEGEEHALIQQIAETRADVVWVGLSTPKQELFMHSMVGRIPAPVMIGVGAAFDFHSGRKRQAPLWIQRAGLEWAFRLSQEPRRLWKRYLHNNPRFVLKWLGQELGIHKYEVDGASDDAGAVEQARGTA